MTERTLAMTAVVLLAAVAPATVAATGQSGSAYAGSHVAFDAKSNALVDYRVDGTTTMESVAVQSRSEAESGLGLDVTGDLAAVTNLTGAALSVESSASASTHATVTSRSGATLRAHDNGHGSLVVAADGEAQVVNVGLTSDAAAEQTGESRVVVTNGDGTKQAFVVAGGGTVTVNENGNVSASVDQGSRLVVRSYGDGRTEADEKQEELIADGTATASVYLLQKNGEAVVDTVHYGGDTTVEVSERSASRVNVTVSRTASQGKVVVVSTSKQAFDATEDVQVSVDGEAAARASSYAELKRAANGGSNSKYVVSGSSSAEASSDVAVAVNHFSSREVSMTSDDGSAAGDGSGNDSDGSDGDSNDGENPGSTSGSGPGFGPFSVLVALAGVGGLVLRRLD